MDHTLGWFSVNPREPLGGVAPHPLDPPDPNTDTVKCKTKLRSA
jgi:hypothetical protein